MALTRSFLRGLKLDDEQVSAIIEAHTETVDGLKGVNADIQKKLEEAEKSLAAEKKNAWAEKYETLSAEFEAYKTQQQQKETTAAKEKAYINLLKDAGVSEKRIESILKIDREKLEAMELDEKGAFKTEKKEILEAIKADWADFITTSGSQGAKVATPPASNTSKTTFENMTLSQKMVFANEHPEEYAQLSASN